MSWGYAILGGVLFGPVGFCIGALIGNNKNTITSVIEPKEYGKNYIPLKEFEDNIDYFVEHKNDIVWKDISSNEKDMIIKQDILFEYISDLEEYEDCLEEVLKFRQKIVNKKLIKS